MRFRERALQPPVEPRLKPLLRRAAPARRAAARVGWMERSGITVSLIR